MKEAEANSQHKRFVGALKAATRKWEFEQINFMVGNHGSVVESDFYTKLKNSGTEAWLGGAEERLLLQTKALRHTHTQKNVRKN